MRRSFAAAALVAALGFGAALATPASAATGQCYDRSGRPVGAPFDTFHPNRGFIDAVIARGGTCTVSEPPPTAAAPYQYPGDYYRQPGNDPGARHSDWCGSSPPSGYCIVPESK